MYVNKRLVMIVTAVCMTIGSSLPILFKMTPDDMIMWSILGGFVGGMIGIWLGVWLGKRYG